MICLGCGANCKCSEPATFTTWPLEQSLSREALADIETAIRAYLQEYYPKRPEELENTANAICAALERHEPLQDALLA